MSLSNDCFISAKHEGTPEGTIDSIGGVPCYIALPTSEYAKDKVVLVLTDVFGVCQNNKLVADDFARNGFRTIMPDYLEGEPIPPFDQHEKLGFNREAWQAKHNREHLRGFLDKVITALKAEGVSRFATTGYCLGGFCFDLAFENITHVTALSHPSRLEVEDLDKYFNVSKAPLLINSCEVDRPFDLAKQAKADEIFGADKFAPGYKRTYAAGCTHGFASHGDVSKPEVKAGKEAAFEATVEWFKTYL